MSAINDFGELAVQAIGRVLDDAAERVQEDARSRAGGNSVLATSIEVTATGRTGERRIRATAPFAKFLEFGTRRNAGRPFLYPALVRERLRLMDEAASTLAQILSRLGGRGT